MSSPVSPCLYLYTCISTPVSKHLYVVAVASFLSRMTGSVNEAACCAQCVEIAFVVWLCHAVFCGLGGKCVCVARAVRESDTCVCKHGVSQ